MTTIAPNMPRVDALTPAAPRPIVVHATLAAVLVGVMYSLSPSSALMAVVFALVVRLAGQDLPGPERRRVLGVVLMSGLLRALAIGAIAWRNDPGEHSFSTLFGDAMYAIRMSHWIKYTYLGVMIEPRDYMEAFDINYGRTSYHTLLAVYQVFVGDAPYGVHVVSAVLYMAGVVAMFRILRPTFGPVAAFTGLCAGLFMPSLFIWSIMPLKESMFFFCSAILFNTAVSLIRARKWTTVATSLVVGGGMLSVLDSLRTGGLFIALGGLAVGIAMAVVSRSRLLLIAVLIAAPFVGWRAINTPSVRGPAVKAMQALVVRHMGHVRTPGTAYRLVRLDYVRAETPIEQMPFEEGVQFLAKSVVAFFLVPTPWAPLSRSDLYMAPQQAAWYLLCVLAVIGAVAGLRRDRLLTCLLAGNVIVGVMVIAPNSGNVGTLIRHRDMVTPFVLWLSGMGFSVVAARASIARAALQTSKDGLTT